VGLCAPIPVESQQTQLPLLECQELFLDVKTSAIAGELAVRANDAMAGDDDWNRIGAIGQANCPACLRISDAGRQLAVRDGLAVRDYA